MKLTDVTIGEVTQSLLAFIVVLGGGLLIAFVPDTREVVAGLIGLVVGFYFNRANGINKLRGVNNEPAPASTGSATAVPGADR